MTDEVWSYIFNSKATYPQGSPVPKEKADILKHHFAYFYPMDVRSSGKDLINNHLSFCLYIHTAIFEEHNWPRAIRTNGHLLLNGEKMSKSTGNSLTLRDSIEKFGADASRLSLADAGDGFDDASFEETTANANILKIHNLIDWCEETLQNVSSLRTGPATLFHDRVFEAEMTKLTNLTREGYEKSALITLPL